MKAAPVLVSACLAGKRCRYDGAAKSCPKIESLVAEGRAIPFCPEVSGGLLVPRAPAEIQGGTGHDVLAGTARVINSCGQDVTAAYVRGSEAGVALAKHLGVRRAVLKEKSPACGVHLIYDGSFRRLLRPGQGVFAAALAAAGIEVDKT
ncbi:MAG TPA: DUF523 domain-containing protein [Firmicutes bacterium]|nr:DUF523 domain-containing protein [Bacillota bacterium]